MLEQLGVTDTMVRLIVFASPMPSMRHRSLSATRETQAILPADGAFRLSSMGWP
jgi:hypothetical protein